MVSIPFGLYLINHSSTALYANELSVPSQKKASFVQGEVLVTLKKGISRESRESLSVEANVEVIDGVPQLGVYLFKSKRGESTEDLVERLTGHPNVEHVGPNVYFHLMMVPNDPQFGSLWGLNNTGQSGGTSDADIDAPEAWDSQFGNSSTIVAVIDSGVDYTHPDLERNIWTNPGEIPGNGIDDDGNGFIDDSRGWNFTAPGLGNNDTFDDLGHGTHVSGIIAAVGNNAVGTVGVAWQSKILPIKIFASGTTTTPMMIIKAITYAADMGAKVINNSYGCEGFGCFVPEIENAVGYAYSKGALFVAAAGNSGADNDTVESYPCSSKHFNVICVGASNRNDQLWSDSLGSSNYGAKTVHLIAPGANILSTVPRGTCEDCDPSGYKEISGTSQATPFVSGTAALILASSPALPVDQVKSAILHGVDQVPAFACNTSTGGRLNAFKALQSLGLAESWTSRYNGPGNSAGTKF